MAKPTTIRCHCGEPCGIEYPARISRLDGGEPSYREGVGENFVVESFWHCSEECAEESRRDFYPDEYDDM